MRNEPTVLLQAKNRAQAVDSNQESLFCGVANGHGERAGNHCGSARLKSDAADVNWEAVKPCVWKRVRAVAWSVPQWMAKYLTRYGPFAAFAIRLPLKVRVTVRPTGGVGVNDISRGVCQGTAPITGGTGGAVGSDCHKQLIKRGPST